MLQSRRALKRDDDTVLLSCVTKASEIGAEAPDLIVLPEYSPRSEVEGIASVYPASAVVAAVEENGRSRGLMLYSGRNLIDYLKMETDGRTKGTGTPPKRAVHHFSTMSVGVVICMDVQPPDFLLGVLADLGSSTSKHKFLCIPADMGSHWFPADRLGPPFGDVYVAMCNHPTNHGPARRRSFIADGQGVYARQQTDTEPIHLRLP